LKSTGWLESSNAVILERKPAGYDVLRDEAEAYAERLRAAGVPTRLVRYDGLIHGFLRRTAMFDRARAALDESAAERHDRLRVGPTAGVTIVGDTGDQLRE
jgi:acetyl esterase